MDKLHFTAEIGAISLPCKIEVIVYPDTKIRQINVPKLSTMLMFSA